MPLLSSVRFDAMSSKIFSLFFHFNCLVAPAVLVFILFVSSLLESLSVKSEWLQDEGYMKLL